VTTVGINEKAKAKLDKLQATANKNLQFLKLKEDEDLLLHVNSLEMMRKGPLNCIFKSSKHNSIFNYPCITKVFNFAGTKIPTDRDPVTCAKIQYLLYKQYPHKECLPETGDRLQRFSCVCTDCYRLAFEEHYLWDLVPFKK